MSSNLKVIKFTLIISGIFLVATYVICLNIAYGWFDIKWISNNFLLAICGGVFASTLVVLFCEVQKYFLNKRQAENGLHACCTGMLAAFKVCKTTLTEVLENKRPILNRMITAQIKQIEYYVQYYYGIDYTTCCKKQELYKEREKFTKFLVEAVTPIAQRELFLEVAINEAKIAGVEQIQEQIKIKNENIKIVLQTMLGEFEECISKTVSFLEKIDYSERYKFKENYNKLQEKEKDFKGETYDDFIKNHTK